MQLKLGTQSFCLEQKLIQHKNIFENREKTKNFFHPLASTFQVILFMALCLYAIHSNILVTNKN